MVLEQARLERLRTLDRPDLAALLDLRPHPEGGWFRRTWTSAVPVVPPGSDPSAFDASGPDPSGSGASGSDPSGSGASGSDPSGSDPSGSDPSGSDPSVSDPSVSDPSASGASGVRPSATAVLYLLAAGEESRWHQVRSDELWLHHRGAPLELRLGGTADEPGDVTTVVLGPEPEVGQQPQVLVPAGTWQAAGPSPADVLVSCVVSPGFDFADWRLAGSG